MQTFKTNTSPKNDRNFTFRLLNLINQADQRYRLNAGISLFCNTFYFSKLQFRNYKSKGVKRIHFLKGLFKTNSEINFYRLWLWRYLRYLAPKITTSQHMRLNEYSLKINVFFYLKAEKAEDLSACF